MRILVILSTLIAVISSCDPADNRLMVVNNSSTDIYVFYSCDSSLKNIQMLRNGYFSNEKGDSIYIQADEYVQKMSTQNIPRKGFRAWKHYLANCVNGEIHFFIYLDSAVNKHTEEELKNRRMYVKHFVYSLDELEKNSWKIRYP